LTFADDYDQAAALAPRVLSKDAKSWEEWIDVFAKDQKLPVSVKCTYNTDIQTIIPYIPTTDPRLSKDIYEMVFEYLLLNDRKVSHFLWRNRNSLRIRAYCSA
jgi:hypothetical protein